MLGLTMKHLRYFDALAEHRQFSRAAEACAITQPALSVQIRELEAMLGAPLVERSLRQVRLTTLGEEFLQKTREILRSVNELEGLVRASQDAFAGKLRLGVIPTVAPYLLPKVIQSLNNSYPGLDLRPREVVTATLIDDLLDGRLDMAIVALPISEPALEELELFSEDFVLVRRSEDAKMPIPDPSQLRQMRLLLLEEGHCFRDQALSFCEFTASQPKDLMEGSSLSTLVQMVGAGLGVTIIPEMALPFEMRSADVAIARFPPPAPSRRVGIVWRKSNPLSATFTEIASVIREAC
ncbi:MAG: hydrogen peroxide-inducible genes activator [Pseudomonadota bacterium]